MVSLIVATAGMLKSWEDYSVALGDVVTIVSASGKKIELSVVGTIDMGDTDYSISCTITNNGPVAGKEVVQLYISAPGKSMDKPAKESERFRQDPTPPAGGEP